MRRNKREHRAVLPLSRREALGIGALSLGSTLGFLLDGCGKDSGAKVPPTTPTPEVPAVKFTDITSAANLNFIHSNGTCERRYFCEQVSAGACLFDANGDGFLDIYFPQPKAIGDCCKAYKEPLKHRLFINDGKGKFTLKEDAFGGVDTDYGIAAAVGDYNNDGHPDLYVCCYGKDKLFRNRGDGTFEDVTDKAGVGLGGFSTSAVWFDYDNDGHLDLFVCRYCEWSVEKDDTCYNKDGKPDVCSPTHYMPSFSVLYHNNGDGTFTDLTHKAGLGTIARRSLGVAAADLHNSGRLDLIVANDMGPNFLYRNLGGGKFEEVGMQEGVAMGAKPEPQANMGLAVGDYNDDGCLDVVVTTFSGEPYTLYKNEGGKYFTDVSVETGVAAATLPMLGFGTGFVDTRNNGSLDLFFANGHVNPFIEGFDPTTKWKQPNQLMLNDGAGKFSWVKDALPASDVKVHKGACFGDIDNDGRIDILVTASNDTPTLLHNDSPPQNWLLVQLTDKHGCCTAIGTRCVATIGGKKKMRVVLGGGSYAGDSDFRVHFGLGNSTEVETLELQWLSGTKQVLKNVKANQILKITESA
jgi:enediyne biosynthesis protein E4